MTFTVIVERELRVAARRRSTFWVRMITALVATGLAGLLLMTSGFFTRPTLVGVFIFRALSQCAWVAALLSGVFFTADCLSVEKRDGTLGLLFLTELRGLDIVLGKLAATSLNVIYGLAAVYPVLATSMVLGGVTWWEFVRVTSSVAATLIFSLALGLAVSSIFRRERLCATLTMLGVAASSLPAAFFPALQKVTPLGLHLLAFDKAYRLSPSSYGCALAVVLAGSCFLLAVAAYALPRFWRDQPMTVKRSSELRTQRSWFGLRPKAARRSSQMLEHNPAAWLISRGQRSGLVWAFVVVATTCLPLVWAAAPGMSFVTLFVVMMLFHGVLKLCITWEASRILAEHGQHGGLELLLVSRVSVAELLQGCIFTLYRLVRGATIFVICADLFLVIFVTATLLRRGISVPDPLSAALVVSLVLIPMLFVDLWALAWLGLWFGLRFRRRWQAAFACIFQVLVLPWALVLLFLLLVAGATGSALNAIAVAALLWTFLSFAVARWFGQRSKRRLLGKLREEVCAWNSGCARFSLAPPGHRGQALTSPRLGMRLRPGGDPSQRPSWAGATPGSPPPSIPEP